MPDPVIRPLTPDDRRWLPAFIRDRWGAETVVAHGAVYRPAGLPGFVAELNGEPVGLLTYQIDGASCEIVTVDSLLPHRGVGTRLIEHARETATAAGCRRLWLITTNDNLNALRFYQKRGFVLAALHRAAVEQARRLKPEIPLVGDDGIPLRDEIELEMTLGADTAGRQPE